MSRGNFEMSVLGENLKKLRNKHALPIYKIAAGTNINPNYLQRMENNKQKNPGLEVLVKLADFYGITIDELVGHQVNKNPKADWWLPEKKGGRKSGNN